MAKNPGGVTQGPRHSEGGIPTRFGELEGGEAVINRRSTAAFRPLLSAINEAGGGRGFDGGLEDNAGGMTTGVVKAFVVTDDITNSQDKLTKIRRKATI